VQNFKQIDLIEPIHRALAEEDYQTPTPIQAKTIPAALQGHDILGCAQTGTGKTAAFALPILDRLGRKHRKARPNQPFVLVLAPTRELAIQIGESFKVYGRHLRLRTTLVFGGVKQGAQVRALDRGTHVLVATPGRLLDLMEQGYIELDQLDVFVLDEADRMLDMGFLPDLKRIIRELPEKRQSLFFSATVPPKIRELSQSLLTDPVSVNVTPKRKSVDLIDQQLMYVDRKAKIETLAGILTDQSVDQAIVFTRTKRGANMVMQRLERKRISAVAIHGNKSQNARQRALVAFRENRIQVLVATDVAARGIDIEGVTHVVNYDVPTDPESYVHRIGRTGRAGAEGVAITFCTAEERNELRDIERLIGMKIPLADGHEEPTGPIIKKKKVPQRSTGGRRRRSSRPGSSGEGGSSGKRSGQRAGQQRKKTVASNKRSEGKGHASSGNSDSTDAAATQGKRRRQRPGKNARRRNKKD
jgi:ATP-dependent RNA helicase RhlE